MTHMHSKFTLYWLRIMLISCRPKICLVHSTYSFAKLSIMPIFTIGSLYHMQNPSRVNPTSNVLTFLFDTSVRPRLQIWPLTLCPSS